MLVRVYSSNELRSITQRAVEIAGKLQCNIYVLFIIKEAKFFGPGKHPFFRLGQNKPDQFEQEIEFLNNQQDGYEEAYPSLFFQYSIRKEKSLNDTISYCLKQDIDLILFFEKRHMSFGNVRKKIAINRLATKVDCPVLNVNCHAGSFNFKSIILPINSFLPLRQLMFASYIGKLFHSKIHLISLNGNNKLHMTDQAELGSLYKAYHLLLDNTNLPVDCMAISAKNIEEAAFQYAKEINADLVLLNSDRESFFTGIKKSLHVKSLSYLPNLSVMKVGFL